MSRTRLALVGNPNCGKTTLFNALTGARQEVGNWPGVTVEKKTGRFSHQGSDFEIVDLPGVYSVTPSSASSEDERIARDHILSGEPEVVVNIVDAANLDRNLYLTLQLCEMGIPVVVALNMIDIAHARGLEVDAPALAERLGCPVVPIVARRRKGLDALRAEIVRSAATRTAPTCRIPYPPEIGATLDALVPEIRQSPATAVEPRWLALQLLEADDQVLAASSGVAASLPQHVEAIENALGETPDIILADARYRLIGEIAGVAVRRRGAASRTMTDRIDDVVLHRALGVPIFLAVMYLMFVFTINIGSAFIDFFDILVGAFLVDGLGALLTSIGAPQWVSALAAEGFGGGVQTVATFIPVVGFLYLFLSLLEDSGYMSRAAFVMDRFMRGLGLPGKAFVPLIVGFGCNVPAVMATRTLENRRDRIITVMMAPFMSCGARLPVYVLFAAAFFPASGQNLVFALYLIGIAVAIVTGLILRGTVLKGETSPFIMEMPPYHVPTLQGVLLRTWERLKVFMWRAGKVIVAIVMVLNVLNSLGTDGSFGNANTDRSVLSTIGKAVTPVFAPLGIQEENWPATVGIFTGIFAKEAVVGTLDALYSGMAAGGEGAAEGEELDLPAKVGEAFATIPANLGDALAAWGDPLGLGVGDLSDEAAVAEEQAVDAGTLGAMRNAFASTAAAFAFLLTVLLYLPCVAAIAAIWREVGTRWTLFAAAWTSGWGYGAGVVAYQAATFAEHPAASAGWIVIVLCVLVGSILLMRQKGTAASRTPHVAAVAKVSG